jgi:REase_MTES_1575/Transcription elongation factor, GreA/GreB, C-term
VGVAGYFVDIGVRHPRWPHGFLLGVECDGANYHSAKSARDRDRLRQEILEGLGWQLHRIWSTDWFNSPQREVERLRAVIAARLEELQRREIEYATPVSGQTARPPQPPESREAVVLPLFAEERSSPPRLPPAGQAQRVQNGGRGIAVGDTVRVQYLTDDRKTVQITISRSKSDAAQGIVHHDSPVAKALLGAEEGDEVEVLVGSFVRPATRYQRCCGVLTGCLGPQMPPGRSRISVESFHYYSAQH